MFLIGFIIGILIVMGLYLALEAMATRVPWVGQVLDNAFALVFDNDDHKYEVMEQVEEEPDDEVSELDGAEESLT